MTLITFAVPEESNRFRRKLTELRTEKVNGRKLLLGRIGTSAVAIAHVGVGLEAAAQNARALLAHCRPERWIAAGFGGALAPELRVGDLVIDCRTWTLPLPENAALSEARIHTGRIVSQSFTIETPADKARLATESGGIAVDMETESIDAICREAGIPLLAIRGISDAAADPLPVPLPAWFDLQAQRPRPAVLIGYLLTHPGSILPFVRFVSGLPRASASLAEFLSQTKLS